MLGAKSGMKDEGTNERDSCLENIAEVLASITVPGCPCLKFRFCIIFRLFNNSVLYHLFML